MQLSQREFNAMNHPLRRWFQRNVEMRIFRYLGLEMYPGDVLEIGCGSGYNAKLIAELKPNSYLGVDIMPEQVALAMERKIPGATFMVADSADLKELPEASRDVVLVIGVLHHIPQWKQVISEIARVLKPGGYLYVEDFDGRATRFFDRFFNWGHQQDSLFTLPEFERQVQSRGMSVGKKIWLFAVGWYCIRKYQNLLRLIN